MNIASEQLRTMNVQQDALDQPHGDKPRKRRASGAALLALAVLFVFAFWLFGLYATRFDLSDPERFNLIGDSFNILNSLFSGLAFAMLIYGLWQQREEIRIQRQEIRLQIEEFQNQTKEFEQQRRALQAQLIETSFSNALTLFYSRINDEQYFFSVQNRGVPLNRHSYFLACHSIRDKILLYVRQNKSLIDLRPAFRDDFGFSLLEFYDPQIISFAHLEPESPEFEYLFFYCIKIEFLSFIKAALDMAVFIEKQVPEDQREPFHIRLVSGLSPEEIELIQWFIKIREADYGRMKEKGIADDRMMYYSNEAHHLLEKSGLLETTESARER